VCLYAKIVFIIISADLVSRGTGIRGLIRDMATLPKVTRSYLWSETKVGRPPGELGVSKSMECDIFHSVL